MPKKQRVWKEIQRYIILFIGSIIYAAGLEIFLVPNNVIDGGVVGIAIMASHLTGLPLGIFLITINIPFIYLGYKQIGKTFTLSTIFSIIILSYFTKMFLPIPGFTDDLFLASIFGGIILGIGVGLIVRYGGSLDGSEIIAILMDKQSSFSVGEIVMIINLFILSGAGLVFGWDRAMYSLVTYFIASKVIDIVIEGLDESKAVIIVSDHSASIAKALMARLGRGVTILHGEGAYKGDEKHILYTVITRLEMAKFKSLVSEIDEDAFITINDVHDVMGGTFKKKAIH
ncbi:YitT family protein [Pelosinus baikalensis]|uniref:YitT family protein n=1 Tax=Pelosinus baikalensis TaxID=2892015 RepID=A0ABS8HYQ0_9FIRM|nr:YitT family protein [Pelosinus baikalensis]MCC5468289.1 YitT family protein [Pelosinus baikalensis]